MALKNLSTVDLQKELERRQKSGRKLESRRAKLVQEIAEIERLAEQRACQREVAVFAGSLGLEHERDQG